MQVGKYLIDSELGRGGFGRVYRAFDPTVGRWVALKVLTAVGEKELIARFRNEAVAAGNLRHENIVTIYEFGEHDGNPFLAMEFIEGEDLQHIISSGRQLTLFEKVRILCQVAAGLHCAHRSGVVHRDVKPANVMLQPNGVVKIMDFGIARLTRSTATRLTQTGYLIGTVMYMSPEQFTNSQVDSLCDIFSYGIISYELLTGHHPFYAPDTGAVMYKLANHDPPPLSSVLPDCPADLEKVVSGALQKDRELRYQSLEDLLYDLDPVLAELRGARCITLMNEARELFNTGSIELAHTKVREVLDFDSGNREARQLRDTLNQEMQRRSVRPKIEALLNSADKEVEAKRFSDAVALLEQARRLARGDSQTENRVLTIRTLIEHRQQSDRLLIRARDELGKKDLTGAYKNVSEALRIDPANTDAGLLLKSIQAEIGGRERERETQEALAKVRGLILLQDFSQALAVLVDLESRYGFSEAVSQLKAKVEKELGDYDRKERLRQETSKIKELLRSDRLDEATAALSGLQAAFPDDSQVADLLAYARHELANRVKKRDVEQAIVRSKEALDRTDFQAAVQQLEEALRRYPAESQLLHVLEATVSARTVFEREKAVSTTLRRCAELRNDKRYKEALSVVARTLENYHSEPLLLEVQREIRQESEAEERAERIRKITRDARGMIEQGNPGSALATLQRAAAHFPDQPEIASILAEAQAEVRRHAIETSLAGARLFSEQGNFPGAISTIEESLATYPGEPRLVAMLQRYRDQKEDRDRDFALKEAARRCEVYRRAHQYSEAIELAQTVLRRFTNDAGLLDVIRQLETDRAAYERAKTIQEAQHQAQQLLESGQPSAAVEWLERCREQYPGEPSIESLLVTAKLAVEEELKKRIIDEQLQRAISAEQTQGPLVALRIIEEALKRYPANSALQTAAQRLQQASRAVEQQTQIQERVTAIQRIISEGDRTRADELIQGARSDYPEEEGFRELAQQFADQQRMQVESVIDRVRKALDQSAWDAASGHLAEGLSIHPGDSRLQDLQRDLESLKARQQVRVQAAHMLSIGEFDQAEQMVRDWTARWGKDMQLEGLIGRIQEERRARQYHGGRERVQQLVENGDFQEALKQITELTMRFPGDIVLEDDARNIRHRCEQHRQQNVERRVGELQELRNAGQAREVLARATQLLKTAENSQARELLGWAESRISQEQGNAGSTSVLTDPGEQNDGSNEEHRFGRVREGALPWRKIIWAGALSVTIIGGLMAYWLSIRRLPPSPVEQPVEQARTKPVEAQPPAIIDPPPVPMPESVVATERPPTSKPAPLPPPRPKPSRPEGQNQLPAATEPQVVRQQAQASTPASLPSPPSVTPSSAVNSANSKPVEVSPPQVVSPPQQQPEPEVLQPSGPYTGLRKGQLRWSGDAPPSARVTIEGLNPSLGVVRGNRLPPLDVQLRVDPPDVKVLALPSAVNRWMISLEMPPRRMGSVVIFWEIKKQ